MELNHPNYSTSLSKAEVDEDLVVNPLPRAVLRHNSYVLLDGQWHFTLDPDDKGLQEGWHNGTSYSYSAIWPGSIEDHIIAAKGHNAAAWQDKIVAWYEREFPLPDRETYEKHGKDIDALRRNAALVGPEQKRTFRIDISKYEFVEPKEETEIDNYTVYVYTLPMLAIEKLRAICQQMPEYELRRNARPRARDFYDIYSIVTAGDIDVTETSNQELVRSVFAAKSVPLSLIGNIRNVHDYHVVDWPAVEQEVVGELEEFDFYFDFVVELAEKLQAIGVV